MEVSRHTTALNQDTLDEIIRRIVAVAEPEKIILFGSAARGEMDRHSDVDLLIVKDGVHRRRLKQNRQSFTSISPPTEPQKSCPKREMALCA